MPVTVTDDLPPVLSTAQLADLLHCSRITLWNLAKERGGLCDADGNVVVRPIHVGRALRWPTAPVRRLLEAEAAAGGDDT